jgi:hypothetical protein
MDWEPQGFNFLTSYFLTLPNLIGLNSLSVCYFIPKTSRLPPFCCLLSLFLVSFLVWPNLTGLNRTFSPFFHPLTPPRGEGGSLQNFEGTVFEGTTYPELGVFDENFL